MKQKDIKENEAPLNTTGQAQVDKPFVNKSKKEDLEKDKKKVQEQEQKFTWLDYEKPLDTDNDGKLTAKDDLNLDGKVDYKDASTFNQMRRDQIKARQKAEKEAKAADLAMRRTQMRIKQVLKQSAKYDVTSDSPTDTNKQAAKADSTTTLAAAFSRFRFDTDSIKDKADKLKDKADDLTYKAKRNISNFVSRTADNIADKYDDVKRDVKRGAKKAYHGIKDFVKFWESLDESERTKEEKSIDAYVDDTYYDKVVAIIGQSFSHCTNDLEIDADGTITLELKGKNEFIAFRELVNDIDEVEFIDADVVSYAKSETKETIKSFADFVKAKQMGDADDEYTNILDDEDDKLFFNGVSDDVDEIELKELPQETVFSVFVYPYPEAAILSIDDEDKIKKRYDESKYYDDAEKLEEVRRMWKVNSKGVKRLKMKCKPGFKWTGNACMKISGAELAQSRIAKRKMVRTKRAKGDALKRKTLRLTTKARRHRKNFGLKPNR